ncbi:hypothetical protein PV11_02158 [Exophiala sideris]|uniref:XRCC4 coiled-coil domain-containing protein n=1 Tax=Exophiala sideris TaxID=1016849 RepID=A0A0D1WCX3_9EURO|nr:hypothetical protein PV11_02158 [Exophiala sideris]
MDTWVIRLSKADKEKSPILVKVSRKEGGHDLDLDLLATDGDAAYAGKVRSRNLKKLRAKNYDGNDDDWIAILSFVFGVKTSSKVPTAHRENLDVQCSVSGRDPNGTLSITLRNKVEDITQQLGSVDLPQTEETDDIDLFGWAVQTIDKRDELEVANTDLQEKVQAKNETVTSLQKQIDELVQAKAEHEQQMLAKFAALLNEKKLKIRNLQRVLSTAQADPNKLKELQAVIGDEAPSRSARGSKKRAAKRGQDDETDDSEGFETMDVDPVVNNPDEPVSPESGRSTPSREASETEDENENLDVPAMSQDRPQTRAMDSGKRRKSPSPLPPPRELPFQRKGQGKAGKDPTPEPPPPADEDEETASEIDEL